MRVFVPIHIHNISHNIQPREGSSMTLDWLYNFFGGKKDKDAICVLADLSLESQHIAAKHKLDIREVLPRYMEVVEEIARDGDPKIDQLPAHIMEIYIRKLVCAIVVCHELRQRNRIKFPLPVSHLPNLSIRHVKLVLEGKGVIERSAEPQQYLTIIKRFETIATRIEEHRKNSVA